MLTQLAIKNIVLIESAEVPLAAGLCVLSGETGAGKSILLDALGLALGARGDAALIRHGQEQGSVTAEFDIAGNARARAVLEELGLEDASALIIRRMLSKDGKTRCLVNDAAVSVSGLRALGETLVEVSGQHDSRGLLDAATHRGLLDNFGNYPALNARVSEAHAQWKEAGKARETLEAQLAASAREEEWLRHIAKELGQLNPLPGEEEELSDLRTTMMQSEKLFDTLNEAIKEIDSGSGKSASAALRSAQRILLRSPLSSGERFTAIIDALDRAANAADEAHEELEAIGRAAPYDPQKLETIEERLFSLRGAARKYNLSVEELPGLQEEAEAKLAALQSCDKELAAAKKAEEVAKNAFMQAANTLTQARLKAAIALEKAVQAELKPLKMENAKFHVRVEALPEAGWNSSGADSVAFEAATNAAKGEAPHFAPINKIASGGELSRFMLAMKVALSETRATPTLIFDEIDTGTGGAAADAIGARLAKLGKSAQVLVVTHLPQVAARGSHHLHIAKHTKAGSVKTVVSVLDAASREEELARMLAGSTITPEARRAAQKLLEDAI